MERHPMRAERRHFTAVQKLAILREHLIEKRPISDVCQKHQIQPTLFYLWQKRLFENGAIALEAKPAGPGRPSAEARKIEALEAKVQQKNEVMAELMGEHVALKKSLGQI
jgi:transposase